MANSQSKNTKFRVLSGFHIPLHYFLKLLKLDGQVFDSKYQLNIFTGIAWLIKSYRGYIVIYDTENKKVAGYAGFISLKDDFYERLRSGEMVDVELPLSAQRFIVPGNNHHLYCQSVVIDPSYRNSMAVVVRMSSAICEFLTNLARHNVYADSMLADAVSREGEELCKTFGLKYVLDSKHNSKIYEAKLDSIDFYIPPKFRETLLPLYKNHFNY